MDEKKIKVILWKKRTPYFFLRHKKYKFDMFFSLQNKDKLRSAASCICLSEEMIPNWPIQVSIIS